MRALSVYFHVPFCRSRCGYCGFYSGCDLSLREPYTAALVRAVETAPAADREVRTVYFGGGTPTLLGAGLVTVLEAVRRRWQVAADAEITTEANPNTVTPELLGTLRAAGFNRISFGLQDCEDEMLRLLGRGHTAAEGEAAVAMAKAAGFKNVSVDFMLATPGQTPEKAERLARYGLSLGVPHLSSYLLKIEEGTPFARGGMAARCPDEDTAADCYFAYYKVLEDAGYRHYEISNAALPGYESRHNTVYWQLGDYLGIGPGAASCYEGRRFRFREDMTQFLAAENVWTLPEDDGAGGDWEEALMLALRLAEGLTPALAARYGQNYALLLRRVELLRKAGLLRADGERIALTDRGFLLSNSIILALLGD